MFKPTRFFTIFNTKAELNARIEHLRGQIKELQELLKPHCWSAISNLKSLDPAKVYYIEAKDDNEMQQIALVIRNLQQSIPWELPKFLIITNPIKGKEVNDTMYRFVMSKRYIKFLIGMEGARMTVTELSKIADMSLQHLYNVTKQFITEGILRRIDENKEVYLELTSKGERIVQKLKELQAILDSSDYEIEDYTQVKEQEQETEKVIEDAQDTKPRSYKARAKHHKKQVEN